MTVTPDVREKVRSRYNYCCVYCGITEVEIGGLLEIEHFHPTSKGGSDAFDNLVYACTTCNRFKANYWPGDDAPENLHLLHPDHENFSAHIVVLADGKLIGITERGWFHIQWLHLNRPQLVELRQQRSQKEVTNRTLQRVQGANLQLRQRIAELEEEIVRLQTLIHQLMNQN